MISVKLHYSDILERAASHDTASVIRGYPPTAVSPIPRRLHCRLDRQPAGAPQKRPSPWPAAGADGNKHRLTLATRLGRLVQIVHDKQMATMAGPPEELAGKLVALHTRAVVGVKIAIRNIAKNCGMQYRYPTGRSTT